MREFLCAPVVVSYNHYYTGVIVCKAGFDVLLVLLCSVLCISNEHIYNIVHTFAELRVNFNYCCLPVYILSILK